ncbi:MAG: hypothetical protein JW936_04485 [Sedimentisphaerales bacterium]|nr:hypothetical protein [Sedimentisphaerales bacterium]
MQKLSTLLIVLILTTAAFAVQTVFVQHNTEAQFSPGKTEQTVITSDGRITLAPPTTQIFADANDVWVINDTLQLPDGSIALATSGLGQIYRVTDTTSEILFDGSEQDIQHIFSLALDNQGRIVAGTGGNTAVLLHQQPDGSFQSLPLPLADPDDPESVINYVWDILPAPNNQLYLATGPQGQILIYNLNTQTAHVVYDAQENNILCLALDPDGFLYAGGDELGIIYRIAPTNFATTVIYDSSHSEISSLVFDSQSNLYAATADAGAARPGAQLTLDNGTQGRPETEQPAADAPNAEPEPEQPDTTNEPAAEPADPINESTITIEPIDQTVDIPSDAQPTDTNTEPESTTLAEEDLQQAPDMPVQNDTPPSTGTPQRNTYPATAPTGNEIYQISPAGFVRSVFNQPVIILDLAVDSQDNLIVATGNEAKLLRLDIPSEQAQVILHDEPSIQITSVLVAADRIYAAAANPSSVTALDPGYAATGTYTSPVIDAQQVSRWGQIQIDADIPPATSLQIATRTGNTEDPEVRAWNPWSDPQPADQPIPANATPGRFLQYRLTLDSTDQLTTPTVQQVKVAHLTPNLPPRITTIETAPVANGNPAAHNPNLAVRWQSADANNDQLTFDLAIRPIDTTAWITIAEELTEPQYTLNTLTLADGRYELKVTASDSPSNPADQALTSQRISDPITVDNTPPAVPTLEQITLNPTTIQIRTTATDAYNPIASVAYCLDSDDFQQTLPEDGIFDSLTETVTFNLTDLTPGQHFLAVRYQDTAQNTTHQNLIIQTN